MESQRITRLGIVTGFPTFFAPHNRMIYRDLRWGIILRIFFQKLYPRRSTFYNLFKDPKFQGWKPCFLRPFSRDFVPGYHIVLPGGRNMAIWRFDDLAIWRFGDMRIYLPEQYKFQPTALVVGAQSKATDGFSRRPAQKPF